MKAVGTMHSPVPRGLGAGDAGRNVHEAKILNLSKGAGGGGAFGLPRLVNFARNYKHFPLLSDLLQTGKVLFSQRGNMAEQVHLLRFQECFY